jgi:hypothetical protein
VLVPPQQDRPFYVYLSVGDTSIASVVVQLYDNKERVVFYLSRRMLDTETRYPDIEKLCLCLFFMCTKLRHILLLAEVIMAEPPELFRLKCASHRYTAIVDSTHFKRNNSLVCRVSARYNHGSSGSKQVYLARRRVHNHTVAHQLLIQNIKHYYKPFQS